MRERSTSRSVARLAFAAASALVSSACSLDDTVAPAASVAASDRLFVSQAGSSTLAVVEAATGETTSHLEVGMLPHNLVLSPDRRSLYVALVGSQAVAEIDVATASLRRTMLTAPVPARRPDGSMIQEHVDQDAFRATTCYGCHRPGGAQPKYAGDRPFGLLVSPDGRRLYVAHLGASRLSVLDLGDGSLVSSQSLAPAGAATELVALARLKDELWVAMRPPQPSTKPGALRRLDADSLAPLPGDDIPTGSDPSALMAVPARDALLVSNFETNTVSAVDRMTGTTSPIAVAPGPLGLALLPDGRVLALDYYANAVSLLNLADRTADTWPLVHDGAPYANPTNAALSSDGRSAWLVASGTDGHLLELALGSGRIVRDLPIDGLSFGIAAVGIADP